MAIQDKEEQTESVKVYPTPLSPETNMLQPPIASSFLDPWLRPQKFTTFSKCQLLERISSKPCLLPAPPVSSASAPAAHLSSLKEASGPSAKSPTTPTLLRSAPLDPWSPVCVVIVQMPVCGVCGGAKRHSCAKMKQNKSKYKVALCFCTLIRLESFICA